MKFGHPHRRKASHRQMLWIAAMAAAATQVGADNFETAPHFDASQFLSAGQLRGANYEVDPVVANDGLLNRYLFTSSYGSLAANSTATARERINEFGAIATLEAMRGSDEFARAVKSGATMVVDGAKELITSPVQTTRSTVSGVTKMFQRAGNTLFSSAPADSQDGRMKALVGFTQVKRQYAVKLGVDPYSANEYLQATLDDVAWSAFAGGISTSVAFAAVPGAAGAAVMVTRTTATGVKADLTKAPLDLEKENRAQLTAMGIEGDIVELFLGNEAYPPSLETYITNSLGSLAGVENRDTFIMVAVQTDDRDVADYRQRQAEMYAGYHIKVGPLARFIPVRGGSTLVAESKAGTVILAAPVDYLAWTADTGRAFLGEQFNPHLADKKKEFWITGRASDRAKSELQKLGWTVLENAGNKL